MAIDSNTTPRKLPYPLSESASTVNQSPQTTPSAIPLEWQSEDTSEIVSIRMDLSLDEYVALATAVDVGSDIAFNEDAIWIWDIWTKAFRGATMTCEDVADCIETSEAVQDAIILSNGNSNDLYGNINPDSLTPSGTEAEIMDTRFPPSDRSQNAAQLEDCNLDELWAGIYFMVQKLDETGRDWLEQAVASGDKWQRAASIVRNIPIVGSLASTALEQLAEVAQDILNLYNAYSTEAAMQEIACDLFEMVCESCRYPTFQEIIDYYRANSTITTTNVAEISLKALVDFLVGSSLAIAQLCYHTVIMFVLWTLYIGSTFVGLRGARWISIWLDNGEEYANDEWQVLCDGCGTVHYFYEVSFLDGDMHGWATDSSGAIVGTGVSWIAGGAIRYSNAWKVFDAPLDIMRVEIEFQRSGGSGGSNQNIVLSTTGTTSGAFPSPTYHIQEDFQPNEIGLRCNSTIPAYGARQVLGQIKSAPSGSGAHIRKIRIWSLTPATGFIEVSGDIPECP